MATDTPRTFQPDSPLAKLAAAIRHSVEEWQSGRMTSPDDRDHVLAAYRVCGQEIDDAEVERIATALYEQEGNITVMGGSYDDGGPVDAAAFILQQMGHLDDGDFDEEDDLDQTSPALADAMKKHVGPLLRDPDEQLYVENTGGGCMVYKVVLDWINDSRGNRQPAREIMLTREDGWIIGFYDHASHRQATGDNGFYYYDEEGTCLELFMTHSGHEHPLVNDADAIAKVVAGIINTTTGAFRDVASRSV